MDKGMTKYMTLKGTIIIFELRIRVFFGLNQTCYDDWQETTLQRAKKKLQASTKKIEKMVEEMRHGMEQTVSSKMPIPRDLSVRLSG